MAEKVFTPEEVASINEYQRSGHMHPFTCGGNRTDANHLDGEGVLVANEEGMYCPYCDYRQPWVHKFMKDGSWKTPDTNMIMQLFCTSK